MSFLIPAPLGPFFFLSTAARCLVFSVLYESSYVLWSPLITARAFMTRPRANAFYVSRLFYNYVDFPSEHFREKYSETFFLNRVIYNLVFRTSIAISPSTDQIIYIVCRIFSVRVQTRGEWKVQKENVWKVRCEMCRKRTIIKIALLRFRVEVPRHNITLDSDFLVSSRFLDPSIASFSLSLSFSPPSDRKSVV